MKYWIRPASLTVEAKQSEIAELFEKFAAIPFVDRINNRASMEHIRRGYLEDFIRESNSSLIEELNVRSLEDLLVSEEVAEEKDEGIAIKNIGLLMFGERPDKLIAGSKIELVRFHDKEAEASDFTEKTFYGPIWKQVRDESDSKEDELIVNSLATADAGLIELQKLEAAEDIAYQHCHSPNIIYLPAGQSRSEERRVGKEC